MARVLGIDLGARRVGLAISDPSRTLARPLATIRVSSPQDAIDQVMREVARLCGEEEGLAAIVVGIPRRLDGTATEQTRAAEAFLEALVARTPLPIAREDERLTSREAESRLAVRERDWRVRKAKLDAAAAAVILQDYLDREKSG